MLTTNFKTNAVHSFISNLLGGPYRKVGRHFITILKWPKAISLLFIFMSSHTAAIPLNQISSSPFPVTIKTAHGTAVIPTHPQRVITLGATTEDWCLLLGIVPIAIEAHYWGGDSKGYLPWFKQAVLQQEKALPSVLSSYPELDIEHILSLKPDLILAPQSGITLETFNQLNSFVPVVAYPDQPWLTPIDKQVTLISTALGKTEEGEALLVQLHQYLASLADANPQFKGKKLAYINAGSRFGNLALYVPGDPRIDSLLALGFIQLPEVKDIKPTRGHFTANIGLEHSDIFNDADLIISWYESEKSKQAVEKIPLFSHITALKQGRYLAITDPSIVMATSYGSLLSLEWVMPAFIPKIKEVMGK